MKRLIVIFFALVMAAVAEARAPEPVWSLERLDLDLNLEPSRKAATITGRLSLLPPAGGSRTLILGMNSREVIVELEEVHLLEPRGRTMQIERITPDEARARRLVRLDVTDGDDPFEEGVIVELSVRLRAVAPSFQFILSSDFALASWVEHWYPAPATEEGAIPSNAAPGLTTLRMPLDWRGVANGAQIDERLESDRRVEVWETPMPMARSFAAGPLERVEAKAGEVTVQFNVLERKAGLTDLARTIAAALAALEKRFGPYPWPSLQIVEIPEDLIDWAASSEQGIIMVRSSVLEQRSGAVPLFAHEGAHAWWGNVVRGEGPGAKMLTEALAQYGAVLAIEALEGRDAAIEFLRFSREGYNPLQSALGYFYMWRQGQDKPLASLEHGEGHNLADSKGMWFYQMLRERLGDEIFFDILTHLLQNYAGSALTLDEFRAIVIAAAPNDDGLEQFLSQWLDRTGAPIPRVDWWSINRGRGIELIVEQQQAGDPYLLELEVGIELSDGSTSIRTVTLVERRETVRFEVPSRAVGLRIDPDHRILLWRPEYGPPPD